MTDSLPRARNVLTTPRVLSDFPLPDEDSRRHPPNDGNQGGLPPTQEVSKLLKKCKNRYS